MMGHTAISKAVLVVVHQVLILQVGLKPVRTGSDPIRLALCRLVGNMTEKMDSSKAQ